MPPHTARRGHLIAARTIVWRLDEVGAVGPPSPSYSTSFVICFVASRSSNASAGFENTRAHACHDILMPSNNGVRFPLGRVVATPGALAALRRNQSGAWSYLKRHVTGDWGDLDTADVEENELSVIAGFRLFSGYSLPDGTRLWIITEADRSCTTLLLPQEY